MDAASNHSWERHWSFAASAMSAFDSFVRSMGRYGSDDIRVTADLQPFSRKACITPIAPLPLDVRRISQLMHGHVDFGIANPPTITMFSCPSAEHFRFGNLLLALMVASSPVMNTAPSFSVMSNLANGSSAGASSTSPEEMLKQAASPNQQSPISNRIHSCCEMRHAPPCHGQVNRPSGETTPFFNGAP